MPQNVAGPMPEASKESVNVPQFVSQRAPRVGLIFGPGGAKTLAQIGVLQEIEKNKLPVVAVAGMEWGALVGGLYALNGQLHEMDWKLSQLPKSNLSDKGLFSKKMKPTSSKEFDLFLGKVFTTSRIEQSKIPFACTYLRASSGKVSLATKGSLKNSMRGCWYFPPMFNYSDVLAAPFALHEAVQFLKSSGAELIILINVLDSMDKNQFSDWEDPNGIWLAWTASVQNLKNARMMGVHEVISIDTSSFKMTDAEQRLRLIQLGKQSAGNSLKNILDKYDF
jgi:NTE family protein